MNEQKSEKLRILAVIQQQQSGERERAVRTPNTLLRSSQEP